MRKIIFLIFLICLGLGVLEAQSLERQVISTTGNYSTTSGLQLSATVGEPATPTLQSGTIILTQGFQQPDKDIAGRIEDLGVALDYTLYPNPTKGNVYISLEAKSPVSLSLRITDVSGKQILPVLADFSVNGHVEKQIDLSQFANGTYLIQLLDRKNQLQKTFKVMKIE